MPRVADLLTRSYFNNLLQPMRIAETIGRSLPGMAKLAVQAGKGDVSLKNTRPAPKTRFNGKVSAHRVWDAVPFKLAEVRAIKEAVPDATVNDVILAVVGGALRTYLKDKGELPKETLTAMAPISVRQEGEKAALGNLVSAMVVGLGTQIEDPLERLRFVHDDAVNSKAMTNAVGAKTLADYSKLIPSGLAGLGARLYTRVGAANMHAPAFNCVVTNVPGSRVPLYFCGARMVAMYGTAPVFDSMGLINPVYSYGDTIAVSFTADRDMLPDPDAYADALRVVVRSAEGGGAQAGRAEEGSQREQAGAQEPGQSQTRAQARCQGSKMMAKKVKDAIDKGAKRAKDATDKAAKRAKDATDRAAKAAKGATDRAASGAKSAADRVERNRREHPQIGREARQAGQFGQHEGDRACRGQHARSVRRDAQGGRGQESRRSRENPGRLSARTGRALDGPCPRDRRADHAVRPRCDWGRARE